MRLNNPAVASDGGSFSFDVEIRAASAPGVPVSSIQERGSIADPGTGGDRTKLGNIIGNNLLTYLTYNTVAVGGNNQFSMTNVPPLRVTCFNQGLVIQQ